MLEFEDFSCSLDPMLLNMHVPHSRCWRGSEKESIPRTDGRSSGLYKVPTLSSFGCTLTAASQRDLHDEVPPAEPEDFGFVGGRSVEGKDFGGN